jgi:CHAD domain-containing protein
MPFVLQQTETLSAGISRTALEELGQIRSSWEASELNIHLAIHETRKSLKRLRSLLLLLRHPLGKRRFHSQNAMFRNTARSLSGIRDLAAMRATLLALAEGSSDTGLKSLVTKLVKALDAQTAERMQAADGQPSVQELVQNQLPGWAEALNAWNLDASAGFSLIRRDFRNTYTQGRRLFRRAAAHPESESLHRWRKQVKYLMHQLQLMSEAWPAIFVPLAEEFHQLSDLLGTEHDLANLHHALTSDQLPLGKGKSAPALLQLIETRRHELRNEALLLGRRIFAYHPKGFIRQVRTAYQTWSTPVLSEPAPAAAEPEPAAV